jgi:hypothetical protein
MSDPCEQKDNIEDLKKGQEKLFTFHDEKLRVINEMRVTQVKIEGDITHIKSRLDNGMSHTLASIHEKMTLLTPVIDHHTNIVKRIEGIGWTLATTLVITLIAYLAWGISHGFTLPT